MNAAFVCSNPQTIEHCQAVWTATTIAKPDLAAYLLSNPLQGKFRCYSL